MSSYSFTANYAKPLDQGREAAFVPIAPLIIWCEKKGFDDPVSAAFAISRYKSTHVTAGKHFVFPSFDIAKRVFKQMLNDALTDEGLLGSGGLTF